MTTKPIHAIIGTAAGTLAAVVVLAVTAIPAHAVRPYPDDSAQPPSQLAVATISDSGIQPAQVAAGTGVGLVIGGGVVTVALRGRRRPSSSAPA